MIAIEAFSCKMTRAKDGGFLTPCQVWGRGGSSVDVSHLLFAGDTLIFFVRHLRTKRHTFVG